MRGNSRRRQKVLDDKGCLLSKMVLAMCPSSAEEACKGAGVAEENLYLIFTLEPLHNLHLKMARLLKAGLFQSL